MVVSCLPIVSQEDYLAHYGRKGMKWYQHIFGGEESKRARDERRTEKRRAKLDKKANKIAKWNAKFDKNLAKATNINTLFFSRFRRRRAENKCTIAMEKILRTGYNMGDAKRTKEYEYGRQVLDHVLKSKGGYPFINYSYNKNTMDRIMRKAALR